jgi:hypothetical protein
VAPLFLWNEGFIDGRPTLANRRSIPLTRPAFARADVALPLLAREAAVHPDK